MSKLARAGTAARRTEMILSFMLIASRFNNTLRGDEENRWLTFDKVGGLYTPEPFRLFTRKTEPICTALSAKPIHGNTVAVLGPKMTSKVLKPGKSTNPSEPEPLGVLVAAAMLTIRVFHDAGLPLGKECGWPNRAPCQHQHSIAGQGHISRAVRLPLPRSPPPCKPRGVGLHRSA